MNTTFRRVSGDVAERIDLEIRKANTMNFSFVFAENSGLPLDLTAFSTIEFEVLNSQVSPVISADLATGLSISGAGSNILSLEKSAQETDINAGKYSYRVTFTKPSYQRIILSGFFYINDGVKDITTPRELNGITLVFINGKHYTVTVSNIK